MNGGVHQTPAPDGGEHLKLESEAQQARAALQALLDACSIKRVVTVDDSNRQAAEQEIDRDLVLAALRSNTLTVGALLSSDTTRGILTTVDGDVRDLADVIDDIEMDPPRIPEDELKELTNAARLLTKAQAADEATATLTESDDGEERKPPINTDIESLTALEALFVDIATFQALTLEQWRHQKDSILGDLSPVLVLFDRDFRLEGAGPTTGDQLIGDILTNRRGHVFCGMITHAATSPDVEMQIAAEIVTTAGIDLAEVIVIARDQVRHAPLDMARKIKAAVLARELMSLRTLVSGALREATSDGITELQTLNAYTLLALVEAASREGTHDARNIIRVAASHTRRSLERRMYHDDVTLGPLVQIRKARDTTPHEIHLHPPDDLAQRRHVDSFDDAEFLAVSNMPLEPGDIFRAVSPDQLLKGQIDEQTARWILLTQPCDTMMRPEGARTGNPKMFSVAPLEWIADSAAGRKVRASDFKLDWFEPDRPGGDWYVRLAERSQIPTIYLDACVLDPEGVGRIDVGKSPPATLTPGWLKRYAALQSWATTKLDRLAALAENQGLSGDLRRVVVASLTGSTKELHTVTSAMDTKVRAVAFGVRRIARLSDPRTRALLTQFAQHLGRAAEEGTLLTEPPSA